MKSTVDAQAMQDTLESALEICPQLRLLADADVRTLLLFSKEEDLWESGTDRSLSLNDQPVYYLVSYCLPEYQ